MKWIGAICEVKHSVASMAMHGFVHKVCKIKDLRMSSVHRKCILYRNLYE
jgi:hypothetical protein